MKKNIFLTGAPSSGKTTVIKKVIKGLEYPANGFYTEEERLAGTRIGFVMKTLAGETGYLAHQDIKSDFRIRRYGVSIYNIETIAVPSINAANNNIIILDEIGRMECFSDRFKRAAVKALDSSNVVVGTKLKTRGDIELIDVTKENRDSLPDIILGKISNLTA
jgi:nucleoside-triphosphatase